MLLLFSFIFFWFVSLASSKLQFSFNAQCAFVYTKGKKNIICESECNWKIRNKGPPKSTWMHCRLECWFIASVQKKILIKLDQKTKQNHNKTYITAVHASERNEIYQNLEKREKRVHEMKSKSLSETIKSNTSFVESCWYVYHNTTKVWLLMQMQTVSK